ncbi:uncharacterized protein AC631_00645 [Debaryomyces fabryi]|uniref:Opaque-phase-specific protein OP4 n=1 Tax=Debaryomyces fabryi TaxID=58627 RepID=A0A0V1Q5K8_9ASCO|nr:uncharacterized protein AC631_00645 [Debaryomyces fabryi]KSA03670.1 hypothetical protein AC631_00645 [Debaryomyces fabryi]CUM52584.1 unnamed protein product [Debaryomyces fabryi]
MKLSTTSAALILAFTASINAAPAGTPTTTTLSKRDAENIGKAIALLNDYNAKRETSPSYQLDERDYPIVTTVLGYIKDTDLSSKILLYFVTNDYFAPIVKDTIIKLIKNGTINLTTLFTSLNNSGLAAQVIEDLINDCNFYGEIYKLAGSYISDLFDKIKSKISSIGSKRETIEERALTTASQIPDSETDDSVLTELMESLKKSGLGTQVVSELIVNKDFLSFGAELIKGLIDQKAITLGELVDAIKDSGLVPSLFKQFFTLDTLKTVTVNALAAAFNKCGGSSATATATSDSGSETSASATTGTSTSTSTGGSTNPTCKKRKRSYY